MNVRFCNISIFHAFTAWVNSSVYKILYKCFKLCLGNFCIHVLGPRRISSNEGKRNIRLGKSIKLTLCLLSCLTKTLHGKVITRKINSRFLFEVGKEAL
mmetsp:Transcript_9962/g.13957  ORF Transcript_9962/g.13957 Transcript_9962/m.13957 type:complete len:99 (-) Transcript_9962:905-1201(-)